MTGFDAYVEKRMKSPTFAKAYKKARAEVGRIDNSRTELWRILAWQVGDVHANRICHILNWYCRLFSVNPKLFNRFPGRR